MLSHAAGVAAAFAIDDNVPAQQLSYAKLAAQLRADGQLLDWAATSSATNGVILDQGGAGTQSSTGWTAGANAGGWNADYWHDGATGKGTRWVSYTPTLPTNGTYEVYLWWVEASNRATNTPVDIIHATGTNRVLLNQRVTSGGWFKVLTTNFTAGTSGKVIVRNDNTLSGQYCVADGVRFLGVGSAASVVAPVIEVVASDAVAAEFGTNQARFTIVRSGDTNTAVQINYTISGPAIPNADYFALPASVTLPAGGLTTNLTVTPWRDALAEGDETVTLTLNSSPNYTRTTVTNATVVIRDVPWDDWRHQNFSSTELLQPQLSGDLADPDGDGMENQWEYTFGLAPKTAEAQPFTGVVTNGHFALHYPVAKAATDVQIIPEASTNLVFWQTATSLFAPPQEHEQGATVLVILNALAPVEFFPHLFFRLRSSRL